MRIHLVNPSDVSFGVAVITPRWLYVLAAATPAEYGDPHLIDETLEFFDFSTISPGDAIGNDLAPDEVAVALHHRVRLAVLAGLVRKKG